MGLLPDTQYRGLRMRRECRERFPRHQLQRKPLVSDPGMPHGTCVTHVPWCMSGSLNCGGRWKRSWHSRRMRNSQFYVSGKRPMHIMLIVPYSIFGPANHRAGNTANWMPCFITHRESLHEKKSNFQYFFNLLAHQRCGNNFKSVIFLIQCTDWIIGHFLWNCSQVYATEPTLMISQHWFRWWLVAFRLLLTFIWSHQVSMR